MKKFIKIFVVFIMCQGPCSYALEYNGVYDNEIVVFSSSALMWCQTPAGKNDISFIKNTSSESGSYSHYVSNCTDVGLNSNFEFIYDGRLIGVDNENLKYYEIKYQNNELVQTLLSYEQVQEIFSDIDVIKLSDFKRGIYTIINHSEGKMVLLYNDSEEKFHKYFVNPAASAACKDLKGLIKLPQRGKITFSHSDDKNLNKYIIKVR